VPSLIGKYEFQALPKLSFDHNEVSALFLSSINRFSAIIAKLSVEYMMNAGGKTPDIQTLAGQFLGKKIDWVAPESPFYGKTYLQAVGEQLPSADTPSSTAENMVHMWVERILQPAATRLAAEISQQAPELAPALKNIDAYAYADDPADIDRTLTAFLKDKAWHPAAENVAKLHVGLRRFRSEMEEPLNRARVMFTRIRHMSQMPASISLAGGSLDGHMAKGVESLATLADVFLELKNNLQTIYHESPHRLTVERAFSDVDDVLKTIAGDAQKLAAIVAKARSGKSEGTSPPPPPPP